uniref:Uncharacterized protein n=1 Tax=Equus caballus TaxID=9796 RepID=A0A3Q2ID88_HORSE
MTSSKIEMPGEVKADPAALMASLHLLPSPTPNLEIKYTKVRDSRPQRLSRTFLPSSPSSVRGRGRRDGVGGRGLLGPSVIPAQPRDAPSLGLRLVKSCPGLGTPRGLAPT